MTPRERVAADDAAELEPAGDPPTPEDHDASEAFEHARDAIAEDAARAAANPPAGGGGRQRTAIEKRGNRWRGRNNRRKAAGLDPLTEAEQLAKDAARGLSDEDDAPDAPGESASGAAPSPGAGSPGAPSRGRPASARATRAELESELATLRLRVRAEDQENIDHALGETVRTLWDVGRRFTPSPDRALTDDETAVLGEVWGKVLGPRMQAVAHATPLIAAIGVTYRVFAPRIESAFDPAPRVAAGSASSRDAGALDPAREVAPAATELASDPNAGAEVPRGADPRAYGYSPDME